MTLTQPSCRLVVIFFCLFLIPLRSIAAQDTAPTQNSPESAKPTRTEAKSTATHDPAKQQTTAPPKQSAASVDSSQSEGEGPEYLRKRAAWFYGQRASVSGRIPGGAYQRAFQQLQRMMQAEGKLVVRPDGSFAEITSPSPLLSQAAVTSTWTSLGPAPATGGEFSPVTGRVMTIAVDPSDTTGNTVLLGGAMGGIWRSTDAGAHWTAAGDQNASLAMGSIAFAAPPNSATVYAGTGELSFGFDTYYGAGVLKSTDHGNTWTQTCTIPSPTCPFIGPYIDSLNPGFGFLNFGGAHISYISVHPTNPNMVLAAVQLIAEGPKEGVYCSDNGGTTWSNVLADEEASFVGFASPTIAYAAFGNIFGSSPGAPNGNGIYKATAVGTTCASVHFSRLTSGTLPAQASMGRIDLGIAPSDTTGNTVYASIADANTSSTSNLGVYLTTNGGTTWTRTSAPDVCRRQCWYDNVVKVDPLLPATAFFAGSAVTDSSGSPSWVVRTTNNGASWSSVIPNLPLGSPALPHVDSHAIAMFKLPNGKVRLYLGNDGGVWRTDDAEATPLQWININNPSLSITQFYPAVSLQASNPAAAFGGTQDNGSLNYQGGVSWIDNQLCGDGGWTAVDQVVPSTVYIGCVTGAPVNVSVQNGALGTFSPAFDGINTSDSSSFVPPLITDPSTANVVYFGTTKVYQSIDSGTTWVPISGDLVSPHSREWITSLAVAPSNPAVVYAGTNLASVFFATNVSVSTSNVVAFSPLNLGGLPPRQFTAIAVDPSDVTGMTLYLTNSGFAFVGTDPFGGSVNDPLGHIFKSTNGGTNWVDVSCSVADCTNPAPTDLPNVPVNDLVIDPDLPNTLYAATDLGVFLGDCSASPCKWTTLGIGLPRVAVISLRLHEASRTLRAGTHGRGTWDIILNNFTFTGPHISSITPISANAAGATFTLTVNGSSLTSGTIQFGGTALTPVGTGSDTSLSGTVPASLLVAGVPSVTVKVASQTSNALPFSVLALSPSITSMSPASTPVQTPNPSTNVPIQINGTSFSSSAKVLWNGAQNGVTVAVPTASCPLPTCLKATLPANLLGPFGSTNDIVVSNLPPGGGKSNVQTFKVAAPPPLNDNFANAINITQLNFADTQDSSGATTEGTDPIPSCVHQFTSAQGNTGGHANGAYNTIFYKFTPQFSANLSVDTLGSSYDSVLSIWTGTQGSLTETACNDDINPGAAIQSQLTGVALTSGTTYYIAVSSFGPPDPNPIALGGKSALNFSYNNGSTPAPTLTSVSPTSANSGDPGFTLTVNGTNFLNGAGVVFIDPVSFGSFVPTTFVGPNQLTASIPGSAVLFPGSYGVSVINPAPTQGGSNQLAFTVNVGTYPAPTLTSISSTSAIAGTLFSVPINALGTNFADNAVLNFNGVVQPSFVDRFSRHTSLQGTVAASALTTPGTYQVSVSNPLPGGGPSNSLPFTVVAPTTLPTITALNPSSAQAGTFVTINVTGTNFLSGAEVCVGTSTGIGCNGTTFVSSTQLSTGVSLPSVAGNVSFYVVDPAPGGTSAPFSFVVVGPPDFTLTSSGSTTQTVNAGATATYTNVVTVTPQNGFTSAVNLTCSIVATATQCSVNPTSLTNGAATVTVTTTSRGLAPPTSPFTRFTYRPFPLYLISLALIFAALLNFTRSRRLRLAFLISLAGLIIFLAMHSSGCGGGGASSPPPPPPPHGTPADTYTITVTATSGSLTHTTSLTLVVQ